MGGWMQEWPADLGKIRDSEQKSEQKSKNGSSFSSHGEQVSSHGITNVNWDSLL